MTEQQIARTLSRKYRLPEMLRSARHRVRNLENEARMFGMTELLTDPEHINRAWEREIELARIEGADK